MLHPYSRGGAKLGGYVTYALRRLPPPQVRLATSSALARRSSHFLENFSKFSLNFKILIDASADFLL